MEHLAKKHLLKQHGSNHLSNFLEWKYNIFVRIPVTCKVVLIAPNRQNAFS